MILDGQFPTTYTRAYQNFEATDTILSLSISDESIPAYWIGWIKWENLCSAWHLSRFSVADDVLHVEDVTRPENLDVGLVSWPTTNLTPAGNYNSFYVYKNGAWSKWTDIWGDEPTVNNRLLNKFDVNTTAGNNAYLQFFGVINEAGYGTGWIDLSIEEIISGTFTKSVTIQGVTFTITQDDLDGTLREQTIGANTIKYAVVDFGLDNFLRPINTSGGLSDFYYPLPTIYIHDTDGTAYIVGGTRGTHTYSNWINGNGIRINPSTGAASAAGTFYENTTGVFFGGFSGDMPLELIRQTIRNDAVRWAEGCNYFVNGVGRTDISIMRRIFAWDDIYKVLSIQMRYSTSNTYTTDASKYYPHISPENEFLCELIPGTDLADLRPWQIAGVSLDAASNTYEQNQKPPYEPDEDEQQNVGASVLRPSTLGVGGTSGFITQYVLTAAEIATLGRTLWTSFINPDYWKNFLFSLALDTGSFDMSSLLDYFVSLRVYPFSLINVPSYAATGSPSIYIGSGMVPLTITGSSTLHTINNFADYIDAGACTVHSAYFHDDFRDFSNVEIMLYLPYCGTVQLNPGDVVGGTLHAQYAIDFATGGCVAYVDLTSADGISYPIAVLPGSIGADVPLTATNAGQIAARFAGDVINFASTVSSNATSDLNARANAATGAITGGASGAVSRSSIGAIATGGINAGLQHASQAFDMATRPAIGIPTLSGGRGFSSFGAPQTAYIQIRRGIYKRPQTYDHTVGTPSSTSKTIGSLAGLVKGAVDTAGLSCTADEAAEVRTLIAAGIIV